MRRIFRMFLQQYPIAGIAERLTADDILTPSGKSKWTGSTVNSILRNEKYKGDALLQKGYTVDFITKKRAINKGELPQYLVEGGHPPIINPAVYAETQRRLSMIAASNCTNPSRGFLSNTVYCGNCGEKFGRRIIGNYRQPNKYKHVVWRCLQTYGRQRNCRMPHLYEEVAAFLFQRAMLDLLAERSDLLGICHKLIASTVGKKKLLAAEQFLSKFTSRSPLDIPFDGDAWRTLIERAVLLPEGRLQLNLFGGKVLEYEIPKYSGVRENFLKGSVLEESLDEIDLREPSMRRISSSLSIQIGSSPGSIQTGT
ncbi:recombinase family protein, partial [Eubacteriales bacterium OttesenSCG-928-N13]|nr:recombinase family protein [Eubacteriales bacterium OttesenSCG-928-N13]